MESVESKLRKKTIFVPTLDSEVQLQVTPSLERDLGTSFVLAVNPFASSEKDLLIVVNVCEPYWTTSLSPKKILPPNAKFSVSKTRKRKRK